MDIQTNNAVVVVSSAGTGDGHVVATPFGQKDWTMKVITPLVAIAIRAAKTYVQTLAGLMAVSVTGAAPMALPVGDFFSTLQTCAGLSVAAAGMSVLTNITGFLTDLGNQFPSLKI